MDAAARVLQPRQPQRASSFLVLVDADRLVYSAAFAAQRYRHAWYAEDADGSALGSGLVDTTDDLEAVRLDLPDGAVFKTLCVAVPEDVGHARQMASTALRSLQERVSAMQLAADVQWRIVLTGSGNWRTELATIRPYKGNRKRVLKPVHWAAVREYLMQHWNAEVVDGREADDAIAIEIANRQYDHARVMRVSIDKDFATIPGLWLNWGDYSLRCVSPLAAMRSFYEQVLVGDRVDNVVGCYRCGQVQAKKLLANLRDERTMYAAVLRQYEFSLTREGCPYANKSAEEALLENAQLLHLERWPGDRWTPPPSTAAALKKRLLTYYGASV